MLRKLSLLTLFSISSFGNTFTFSTTNWEPYIGQSLKNHGFLAVIIKEAFRASGHEAKFKFLPWARALKMVRDGSFDGYLPGYYSKERNQDCAFSAPIFSGAAGLYVNKASDNSKIGNYKEFIKGKKVGLVRGYVNTKYIDEHKGITKDYVKDDISNMRKLAVGRVDYIFIDFLFARYFAEKDFKLRNLAEISPPIEMKKLYVCFSKKKKGHEKIVKQFNEGLKKIQHRIPKILEDYKIKNYQNIK
jgi:ABC-type amino acid transport substrate-binding protein